MKCCGEDLITKFCPRCGKERTNKTFQHTLQCLLGHVRKKADNYQRDANDFREWLSRCELPHKNITFRECREHLLNAEGQATTWAEWLVALREAIEIVDLHKEDEKRSEST